MEEAIEDAIQVKKLADNVGFFCDDQSSQLICRLSFGPKHLSNAALLWKLKNTEKSVIVQLKLGSDYTNSPDIPNIFIFQSSDLNLDKPILNDYETDIGVLQWFLETRLSEVLKKNWETRSTNKKNFQIPNDDHVEILSNDEDVEMLVGMGFHRDAVVDSLRRCNNDVAVAVNVLLGGEIPKDNFQEKKSQATQGEKDFKELKSLGFEESAIKFALEMYQGDAAKAKEFLEEQKLQEAEPVEQKTPSKKRKKASRAKKAPKKPRAKKEVQKKVNPLENLWTSKPGEPSGFLARLYLYITEKLKTCGSCCLICEKEFEVVSYKLPLCSNATCLKTYESTTCGSVTGELQNQPVVVDLLINLLYATASGTSYKGMNRNNNRNEFQPFPQNLGFDSKNGQDHELLLKTLDCIPSVEEMQKYPSDEQLKAVMDETSPLAFPLLRWILHSNRTHITLIPKEKQFQQMKTNYQFQLVSSKPEHEQNFQSWKQTAKEQYNLKKGSFHAFHGSPITNWHSIVRTGLKSGHVPGIWMSQNFSYSFNYMKGSQNVKHWPNSSLPISGSMECISLLEVADFRRSKASTVLRGGDSAINIARNPDIVVTRYLFFYPKGAKHSAVVASSFDDLDDSAFFEEAIGKKLKPPVEEELDEDNYDFETFERLFNEAQKKNQQAQ